MRENRKENSRERIFLEIDEIKRLIDLGLPYSEMSSSYKWTWPEGLENHKQLILSDATGNECELPTYCFQELLQRLPKWIDMPAPGYLVNCYHDCPVGKDDSGKDLYRHFLNFEISVDGQFRIGYRNEYFDCISPRYPFPECPENPEDQYLVMNLPGGLVGEDWLSVVYDLFVKLLEDKICKFS